jgi:hypothetical protein
MNTDIVFISSVIGVSQDPLTYTKTRSVFTAEERFQQTLETIESIRKYMPNAKIFLVETSEITNDQTKRLEEKVDFFVNSFEDTTTRVVCLHSPKKGFGEAIQTKVAIQYLLNKNIPFHLFFKISGRYSFTKDFRYEDYSEDQYTFYRPSSESSNSISTVVYSVPYALRQHFAQVLDEVIQVYSEVPAIGLEEILPFKCLPRKHINTIGVEGLVSVTGTYFSC